MNDKRCIIGLLSLVGILFLGGCGGGNGLGPKEIKKQEDKVLDRLTLDWNDYNSGNYQASIDRFTQTLEQADKLEGSVGVQNRVKSEAFNGIAWNFFRMQDLAQAWDAFRRATSLDRQNSDAWVGWAGVALAQRRYGDVVQFSIQAMEVNVEYKSALRTDNAQRNLGHDLVDGRHLRLMLAEAYFQLGRYSVAEKTDPNNAAAQVRLIDPGYRYRDPGQLVQAISRISLELKSETEGVF